MQILTTWIAIMKCVSNSTRLTRLTTLIVFIKFLTSENKNVFTFIYKTSPLFLTSSEETGCWWPLLKSRGEKLTRPGPSFSTQRGTAPWESDSQDLGNKTICLSNTHAAVNHSSVLEYWLTHNLRDLRAFWHLLREEFGLIRLSLWR